MSHRILLPLVRPIHERGVSRQRSHEIPTLSMGRELDPLLPILLTQRSVLSFDVPQRLMIPDSVILPTTDAGAGIMLGMIAASVTDLPTTRSLHRNEHCHTHILTFS